MAFVAPFWTCSSNVRLGVACLAMVCFAWAGAIILGKAPITIANISVFKTQCPMVHVNLGNVEQGTCSCGFWPQLQLIARLQVDKPFFDRPETSQACMTESTT